MKTMFELGSTLVQGLVAPKLLSIVILLFSLNTALMRMYISIVVLCAFNGLITFPLILSKIGAKRDMATIRARDNERELLKSRAKQEKVYFERLQSMFYEEEDGSLLESEQQ